jgi:two-component system, NtrC family, response regulator HydG
MVEAVGYALVVIAGPDTGKVFTLDGSQPSRAFIGQSTTCDFPLTDPAVSRRHAALDLVGQRLRVTDLGSEGATYANGIALVDAFLSGGEVLTMGATQMRVDRVAGKPPAAPEGWCFGRIVGSSPKMQKVCAWAARVADVDWPVILEGETGTGKELVAEALHEGSTRADGPFIVFDCTATPASQVELMLFGEEGGRKGVFEQANGGTLFIDEIGDLDVALQPKLLRAIERSEIQRSLGDRWIHVDVRVIAATRRDLEREVQAGRFRNDLFHRLAVSRVELPPLRQRDGDVPVLARHFWRTLAGKGELPPDFLARAEGYEWPGNVRELHHAIVRRIALGELAEAPSSHTAPEGIPALGAATARETLDITAELDLALSTARQRVVQAFERRYVEQVLKRHGGNVARAASASGIARRYFQVIRARLTK